MGSAAIQGELWGRAPRQWAMLQEPMHTPLWEAMLNSTKVRQGSRFLDAGCGGGGASMLASERGALISGLDILLVHFNDLLNDLDGEMRRIAKYLDIEIDEENWPKLVDNSTFKTMKRNAEQYVPGGGSPFIGGAQRFLFKGTNGRWKGILSAEELALYEQTVADVLTTDCARWLEQGRSALL